MNKILCALSVVWILLFVAASTSAQVVRQVTDEKTVSFGTAAMDDSGQTVWIGSTADPVGDNPEHAFRLVAIDPTTAVSTQSEVSARHWLGVPVLPQASETYPLSICR